MTEGIPPEYQKRYARAMHQKFRRTLIHCLEITHTGVRCKIVGWNPRKVLEFPLWMFPQRILASKPDPLNGGAIIWFAKVNIGALSEKDLWIKDFEPYQPLTQEDAEWLEANGL